MKKMTKKIHLILILLIFSSVSYALCPPDCEEGFAYGPDELSQIDSWQNVNVNEIPVSSIKHLDLADLSDQQINDFDSERKRIQNVTMLCYGSRT